MPDQFQAEAVARKVREDLERELFTAQQRVPETEARAKAAGEAIEAKQRETLREQEEAAAAALRADGQGRDFFGELSDKSGDTIGGVWGPPLPPPDPGLVEDAIAAEGEAEAARADVARLRQQIGDLPPAEDILGEIDDVNPEWGGQDAVRTRQRRLAGGFGLALTAGGLVLLWQSFQVGPNVSQGSQPSASAPVQSAPGQSAQPSAAPSVASAPPPIAALPPITGTALAFVDFTRIGSCPTAAAFKTSYQVDAVDGKLSLTQLDVGHVSTGTVDRTGKFETKGQDQGYNGLITGTWFRGMYTETGGCDYSFDGQLSRPFLAAPPFGTAPGHFEFLDPQASVAGLGLLDIAPGRSVHVIVSSDGTPDIPGQLPIRVVGTAGDDTIWDFTIDGDPAVVCRGPTGCSANAPTPRLAAWDDETLPIVIIATGSGDDVIAVHAPHGVPAVAPAASTAPSIAASIAPSAAPSAAPSSASASAVPATPPPAAGGGPNVALATAGTVMFLGGLGLAAGGFGWRRRRPAAPAAPRSVSDAAVDLARDIGVDPRPPVATTVPSPSVDPLQDEIESKARSLEQEAARKEAEAARWREEEERPIEFGDAFVSTVNALGGAAPDSGPPVSFILDLEEDAKRLRAEAAALRAQLKP